MLPRRLILLFPLALAITLAAGADAPTPPANATNHFIISGMHCDGCAKGLAAELKLTRGVVSAQVTFSNKLAVIAYDTNQVNAAKLTRVIKTAGFTAETARPEAKR